MHFSVYYHRIAPLSRGVAEEQVLQLTSGLWGIKGCVQQGMEPDERCGGYAVQFVTTERIAEEQQEEMAEECRAVCPESRAVWNKRLVVQEEEAEEAAEEEEETCWYTVRALGRVLLTRLPWRVPGYAEPTAEQLLTQRFSLLEALVHHDHAYATSPITRDGKAILVVRFQGHLWGGGEEASEKPRYEVSLYRFNARWERVDRQWYEAEGSYEEAAFLALMERLGVGVHEAQWLATDAWDYQRASKLKAYTQWVLREVAQVRKAEALSARGFVHVVWSGIVGRMIKKVTRVLKQRGDVR